MQCDTKTLLLADKILNKPKEISEQDWNNLQVAIDGRFKLLEENCLQFSIPDDVYRDLIIKAVSPEKNSSSSSPSSSKEDSCTTGPFTETSFEQLPEYHASNNKTEKEYISEGGFAAIYREGNAAIKEYSYQRSDQELLTEANFLIQLSKEESVVNFLGVIAMPYSLVTEWMDGGDLDHLLFDDNPPKLDQNIAFSFCQQMCHAVERVHSYNILHRDIKLDNFLLTDKDPHKASVKITDFGLSIRVLSMNDSYRDNTKPGHSKAMAPEVLYTYEFSEKSDIYALGISFLELINQQPIYGNRDIIETMTYRLEDTSQTVPTVTNLPILENEVKQCLSIKPEHRPTAAKLGESMAQIWRSPQTSKDEISELALEINKSPTKSN